MRNRLLLLFILVAGPASAAPFCTVIQGIAPECIYYDARQCWQRATQLGGICNANPQEVTLPKNSGRFCFVDSSRAVQCIYPDRSTCNRDAARQGGACVDSLDVNATQPNPYQIDPQVRY